MAIVNHDFPGADDMLVVDETNEPIAGAIVKIYNQTAFDAGVVDTWESSTTTDAEGKWIDPVTLADGQNWIVLFEKPSMYAAKHIEITT